MKKAEFTKLDNIRRGADTISKGRSTDSQNDSAGEEISPTEFLIQSLLHDLNNKITMIAHSAELAEMVDTVARYREACRQIMVVCDHSRLIVDRLREANVRGAKPKRFVDLPAATLEASRMARALLPKAESLKVDIPSVTSAGSAVQGNINEIQELFFYLVGAFETFDESSGRARPELMMTMEQVDIEPKLSTWMWRLDVKAGSLPPTLWSDLWAEQESGSFSPNPFARRAHTIIKSHSATLGQRSSPMALTIFWATNPNHKTALP